ncbi:hypothetical protein TcasGA2_TC009853 [Tribolium castaneum]|uniref:Uncharacterized protein n=1 Tax=Tribolium castaneum TaxID=7070 RepID=D6WQ12_TRICA|nr:hypothetical protein TcasGA2_TC009853 [Tribolium castaneum]
MAGTQPTVQYHGTRVRVCTRVCPSSEARRKQQVCIDVNSTVGIVDDRSVGVKCGKSDGRRRCSLE